jgi:hypothetical protein
VTASSVLDIPKDAKDALVNSDGEAIKNKQGDFITVRVE